MKEKKDLQGELNGFENDKIRKYLKIDGIALEVT